MGGEWESAHRYYFFFASAVDCTFNHFFIIIFFPSTSLFLLPPLRVWYSIVTEGQLMVRVSFFFFFIVSPSFFLFFFPFLFSVSSSSSFFSYPFQHHLLLFHLLILILHTEYFFVNKLYDISKGHTSPFGANGWKLMKTENLSRKVTTQKMMAWEEDKMIQNLSIEISEWSFGTLRFLLKILKIFLYKVLD